MKKFFLNALSSFVGAWVAIVLAGAVAALLIFAFVTKMFGEVSDNIEDNSVLEIKLEGEIVERDDPGSLSLSSMLAGNLEVPIALETTVYAIQEAKSNDKIKAIYLDCGQVVAAPATLQALRTALIDFKKSGKKVYAYADIMSQEAYYVASVANEISLNPAGNIFLTGLGGQTIFFKGLFDKIGVSFQVVRVGKGKAAVEPYTQDTMSVVARAQSLQMLDTLWTRIKQDISASRKAMTPAYIEQLINEDYVSQKSAKFVYESKIVDRLEYRHDFETRVAKAVGQGDKLEHKVSPMQLATYAPQPSKDSKDQVAVVYACGGIDDIMGGDGINSTKLVEQLLELKDDENVKALVLRVNSPGGSAFGSEQIWEALNTFKKSGKPFIVSMGDYAASGGYYISVGADRIFANPLCITGSIGIFGLIPNVKELMNKVGLHSEMVATNPSAQFPNLIDPLNDRQLTAMQAMVEEGYALFVKRCAEGRGMSVEKIKEIADGRPLPALTALHYGLVDELGTLQDAVSYAAKQAKLKDYNVVNYPEIEMSIFKFMANLQNGTSQLAGILKLFTAPDLSNCTQQANALTRNFTIQRLIRAESATFSVTL